MLRLLHCIHSLNPAGGGPADFVRQAAALSAGAGVALEIACLDAPESGWLADFPCPVHALGPGAGKYGYSTNFLKWLRNNLERFQGVIVSGLWQFPSLATWLVLKDRPTIPYFVLPHGMLDPWFNEQYPLKRFKKELYWRTAEYFVLRDARAVFFTAREEMERCLGAFSGMKRVRALVAPYGTVAPNVEPEELAGIFFKNHPELADRNLILFLGRLHEKKGCDLLVKAMHASASEFPRAHLIIAGPADARYEMSLNPSGHWPVYITRLPFVSGDEKWSLIAAAEAMILPSHQENFARSISEALSCSTPALISNKVNIWSDVLAEHAGMVADDDLDGTISLLHRFLQLTPDEKSLMRVSARQCFDKHFDLMKNFPKYIDLIRSEIGFANGDDLSIADSAPKPRLSE